MDTGWGDSSGSGNSRVSRCFKILSLVLLRSSQAKGVKPVALLDEKAS